MTTAGRDNSGDYGYNDFEWKEVLLWPEHFRSRKDVLLHRLRKAKKRTGSGVEESSKSIELWMNPKNGKVSDAGYDQAICWCTKIPAGYHVRISAKVLIKSFLAGVSPTYQEGFGVFLRDTMKNDGKTGHPYSDMVAAGGFLGCYNVLLRTGVEEASLEQIRSFSAFPKEQNWQKYQVKADEPRTLHITLCYEGTEVWAEIVDEAGNVILQREGSCITDRKKNALENSIDNLPNAYLGDARNCDAFRVPEKFLEEKERGSFYLGFLAAAGSRIAIEKETVRITLSKKQEQKELDPVYAAPNGTSSGNGSGENPLDLLTAIEACPAGGKVIVLPGTYSLHRPLEILRTHNGQEDAVKSILADRSSKDYPVLDFCQTQSGFRIAADYWHITGLKVVNGLGFQVEGSHNRISDCVAEKNLETGFLIRCPDINARREEWPSWNVVEDCTSRLNRDPSEHNADGFACKVAAGQGNQFVRCLSVLNSDDGFDLFAKNRITGAVKLIDCKSVLNGYQLKEDGSLVETAGNGNGFKLGGSGVAVDHKVIRCQAVGNRGCGFTSNSNPKMDLFQCIATNNKGVGYQYYFSGRKADVKKRIVNCREVNDQGFDPKAWFRENKETIIK